MVWTDCKFLQIGNQKINPLFYDSNAVFVRYCSGDLWLGNGRNASYGRNSSLFFGGHQIISAVLEELLQTTLLKHAAHVIWSGESAGGIGSYAHLDFVADLLPQAHVVGAPIAGWYFPDYPYSGPGSTSYVSFTPAGISDLVTMYGAWLPPACISAGLGALCAFANSSFDSTRTPAFFLAAQTDRVVLPLHCAVPGQPPFEGLVEQFVLSWKTNMTNSLARIRDTQSAFFNPACWLHTGYSHVGPFIDGMSYMAAFNAWFKGYANGSAASVQDTCNGVACNPTCPPVL